MKGQGLGGFIRDGAITIQHQMCAAKMGCDAMSVADSQLNVNGMENLRIADASVIPLVTTGNTMVPCAIIGERAVEVLRVEHKL